MLTGAAHGRGGGARREPVVAATVNGDRRVPEATVRRLPTYLAILLELSDRGIRTVSSDGLARAAGVTSAQVRKDLSFLGTYGTRGVGYPVRDLLDHIGEVLGLDREWPVVLVGVGNLGRALASYGGFAERGFELVALFDADPARVGDEVAGHRVSPLKELEVIVTREGVAIAVLAVPAEHAQEVADRLTAVGVTSILNFAPTHLEVPAGVRVRRVDVSTELQILAYHEQQRRAPTSPPSLRVAPRAGQQG